MTRSTNSPLAGPAWIILASAGFATGWVLVRIASENLHPFAIVFWRNIAGIVLLVPFLVSDPSLLSPLLWKSHAVRATSGVIAMLGTFYAIANAPLATVQAINFAAPIIATAGAALFLKERLRARRIGALLVGFAGMLIVLRPGALPLTPGIAAAVIAAAATAFSLIAIKHLVGIARPMAVVLWSYALPVLPTAIVASFFWTLPQGRDWLLILGIGATTLIGQIATTRAFSVADATAVMPFDFIRFGLMIGAGIWLFDENVDGGTLVGGAVILSSTLYLAYRETVLARRGPASVPPIG